jgi:hypothetical protein
MGGLRRNRRLLGWLAAIALLGNALAMALLPRPAAAVIDDILGAVAICTADGAKTLHDDGSGRGGHSPSDHCPACVTVAQFALAVAIVLAALVFPLLPAARPRWERPAAFRLRLGGISARAPPLCA